MNRLTYLLPLLFLACQPTASKNQEQSFTDQEASSKASENRNIKETITFQRLEGQAILIGHSIDALNPELQNEFTLKEGALVKIIGVSDSLFQETEDYCDAFNYLKIKYKDAVGIIDGRNVYPITASQQDTFFNFNGLDFELLTTSFFGIGMADEDGLTFCNKYKEPVVLVDATSKQTTLIELVKNEIATEASWHDSFNYFELMANDGAFDKITQITPIEKGVVLTVKREFQEGWNLYEVELNLTDQPYKAEYLSYGSINY